MQIHTQDKTTERPPLPAETPATASVCPAPARHVCGENKKVQKILVPFFPIPRKILQGFFLFFVSFVNVSGLSAVGN
jgi:hypothetical protein